MTEQTEQRRYHHGELRGALMEAAERSLRERGPAQLSLRDLAREVGVSHAAPRRHFPERQDLLDALAEAGFSRLGGRIRDAVAAADDESFASRAGRASAAFAHFATDNPALLELMNATKHQPDKPAVTRSAEAAFAPLVDLIREGQDNRILRKGSVEEIGIILYATINGLATLVNSGLVESDRLDELVETAVGQFLGEAEPT